MRRSVLLVRWLAMAVLLAGRAIAQDPLLDQAARLDSEQKCAEADSLYQKALALAPDSPAVLNNLGNHYLSCGAPERAQDTFQRLLRLKPQHVNGNLQLARLAVQRKNGSKALGYLASIDSHSAADPEILLVKAEALAQSGRRVAAEGLIRQLSAGGNDPRILYALGLLCGRTGFYPAAENAFARLLAQLPNDFDVLYNFAVAAARCGHVDKARGAFEAALRAKPDDVDCVYELGRVETSAGDYKRAVYLLAQAGRAAPARPEISLALARASQMAGFYGDSLLAYDRYLSAHPDHEMVKRDRALVAGFTRAGQSEALGYLDSYVARHPADAIGFYDLAQLSYRANRTTALTEVSKAVALDPRLAQAFFFRAWLHNKAGRYAESLSDAERAAKLNEHNARVLDLIGLDNLELGRAALAEKPLRAAVALSPSEPDFLFHLGRALLEQGRRDEARPILAQFQKVRDQWTPAPREEAGVIDSATLSPRELARRVVGDYQEAVRANPNEPALRLNLGRALLAANETDEALAVFRQMLAAPPSAALLAEAGHLLLQDEQYELAVAFLKSSSEELLASRLDLATALYFKGDFDAASAVLTRIPDDSQQSDAMALKAMILAAHDNKGAALPVLEKVSYLSIANSRVASEAAVLLSALGEHGKAFALVEQARKHSPNDARLALTRAALLSRLNRVADAELAIKEIETRWPEWDRPYLAEALLLEKIERISEAKVRFDIGAALGPADPAVQCLREHFRNRSAPGACACSDFPLPLWVSGCS